MTKIPNRPVRDVRRANVSYSVKTVQRITVSAPDGRVMLKEGDTIYLTDEEGYPQWSSNVPDGPTMFATAVDALTAALNSSGMPWWFKPDMTKLQALRIIRTVVFRVEEVKP